ncbi:SPOSA6832_03237, partial [Sporobolomyces salmonicolor]
MFGKPNNPYEEIIGPFLLRTNSPRTTPLTLSLCVIVRGLRVNPAKATDEKQTEINWEIALTVWDKVNEDGEAGARNCVAALQKRLTHRSANVQLFSLTLAGALVNNCGPPLHREISGKAFTQTLIRLINDRTTHENVKKEALKNIEDWVKEHPNNSDFDLMGDTYETLKRQNHRFGSERQASPARASDDALRREEEELQRALAESAALADPMRGHPRSQPPSSYDSRKALPHQPSSSFHSQTNGRTSSPPHDAAFVPPSSSSAISAAAPQERRKPSRVKALFDFEGQTPEELPFRKGDVISVVECVYADWWKGELRGRVGIFPTNHVLEMRKQEELPEPDPRAQAREQEQEAEIFAQAAMVDRLLDLMRALSARGEDFADNDELTVREFAPRIAQRGWPLHSALRGLYQSRRLLTLLDKQDLYNSSMALRPKVVQLIRQYDQKQGPCHCFRFSSCLSRAHLLSMSCATTAELQAMDEKVNRARATYEQMTGEGRRGYEAAPQPQAYAQPNGYALSQQPPQPVQPAVDAYGRPYDLQVSGRSQPPQGHPSADLEEQQRREYELKWAEYERQLAEYNAQVAQHQQYYQQHQAAAGSSAPPRADTQAAPSYPPLQAQVLSQSYAAQQPPLSSHAAPSAASPPAPESAASPAPPPSSHPQAPQPVWDPQSSQWVWPQVAAVVQPAAPSVAPSSSSAYPPQPYPDPDPHPHPQDHLPPPHAAVYSSPPLRQAGPYGDGLAEQMSALSVQPPRGGSPALSPQRPHPHLPSPSPSQGYYVDPYPSQQQQQDEGQAAAWAAWHATQAQQQQQQQPQQQQQRPGLGVQGHAGGGSGSAAATAAAADAT